MNRTVSNRRLLKLAAFLRTLPRDRFDYKRWVGADWKGKQDLSCGTTACALGWAATIPAFRRLGLRLRKIPGWDYSNGEVVFGKGKDIPRDLDAARALFGLNYDEAYLLFAPAEDGSEANATPKYVARKIEKLVKCRQP